MSLPEGNWLVDYFITQDDGNNSYPSYPAQPFRVTVNKDTTYHFDLSDVEVISASISGTVRDETGTALKDSMVYVWAFREEDNKFSEFWNEVQTDEDGNFSIPVLPGGRYEVGIFFLKICERRATWMLLYSSFVLRKMRMRLGSFSILLCLQKTTI